MLKSMLLAAILGCSCTPLALAQDTMKCDEATLAKMTADMDAMVDPAVNDKKEQAKMEMEKAKEALAAQKTDECLTHLQNAMNAMKKS